MGGARSRSRGRGGGRVRGRGGGDRGVARDSRRRDGDRQTRGDNDRRPARGDKDNRGDGRGKSSPEGRGKSSLFSKGGSSRNNGGGGDRTREQRSDEDKNTRGGETSKNTRGGGDRSGRNSAARTTSKDEGTRGRRTSGAAADKGGAAPDKKNASSSSTGAGDRKKSRDRSPRAEGSRRADATSATDRAGSDGNEIKNKINGSDGNAKTSQRTMQIKIDHSSFRGERGRRSRSRDDRTPRGGRSNRNNMRGSGGRSGGNRREGSRFDRSEKRADSRDNKDRRSRGRGQQSRSNNRNNGGGGYNSRNNNKASSLFSGGDRNRNKGGDQAASASSRGGGLFSDLAAQAGSASSSDYHMRKLARNNQRGEERNKFDRDYDPKTQKRCCIIFRGLPGAGKTTCANMLKSVLGGNILNFDEVVHKYQARIKQGVIESLDFAWLTEVEKAMENDSKRFLFIDRVHKLKDDRDVLEDIIEERFVKEAGGKVLFVDFVHAEDPKTQSPDGDFVYRGPYSAEHIDVCAKRVQKRAGAHYTHLPGTGLQAESKALDIVSKSAALSEFLSVNERDRWGKYFFCPVEYSPVGQTTEIITALRSFLPDGWQLLNDFAAKKSTTSSGKKTTTGEDEDGEKDKEDAEKKETGEDGATEAPAVNGGSEQVGGATSSTSSEAKKEEGEAVSAKKDGNSHGEDAENKTSEDDNSKKFVLIDPEQLKKKLLRTLDDLNQRERLWRGVQESEICAHCKVEQDQVKDGLTNITSVLLKEEEEEVLAQGRIWSKARSKVRDTRLCRACWTAWNLERKEKERVAKEKEAAEMEGVQESKRLYWEIRVDEKIMKMVSASMPENIKPIEEPHVTLVYFGAGTQEEEEAQNAGVDSVEVLEGLHETLSAMDGNEVVVILEKIVVSPTLVCAEVSIDSDLGMVPSAKPKGEPFHVTLGVAEGTKPVESAEVIRKVNSLSAEEQEANGLAAVTLKKPKKYNGVIQLKYT
ncbi:unnamed protein product [Amoebophrya sp. A25]|nr:unnamed protein product [Amoebophrya sp. A25]|eukprot:GSA25T00010897001.1